MAKRHVILLAFIHVCCGGVVRNETTTVFSPFRHARSGGYPKFPVAATHSNRFESHMSRDTYYTSKECGTRTINFDPSNDLMMMRKGKIVGGLSTPYGAYPWQVEIQIFRPEHVKFEHHCGGAVIGKNLVLTAAHCLQGGEEYLRIVIGDHILEERDLHERSYKVESVLIHPEFRRDGPYSNDIAIIKLKAYTGIGFNTHVRPICLPNPNDQVPVGTLCSVTGWGIQRAEDLKSLSSVLRVAVVPIIDTNMCRDGNINGGRHQKILDSMLCAGLTDGGMDACQGDSGGPLSCRGPDDRFILAGLVSWGDGCAKKNRPGVYTRVDSFMDWISKSIRELE